MFVSLGGRRQFVGEEISPFVTPSCLQQLRSAGRVPTMSFVNKSLWTWVGKSRRHTLRFEHNTFSGVQQLWVNDSEVFKSSWRFKLTGSIQVPIDESIVEIYILCDEWGVLHYKLTVDAKLVIAEGGEGEGGSSGGGGGGVLSPSGGKKGGGGVTSPSGGSKGMDDVWHVRMDEGRTCVVEYHPSTLDILVNGIKADVEGDFVEEEELEEVSHRARVSGVRYGILLPPATNAQLTVIPGETARSPHTAVLTIKGVVQRKHAQ